jgi:hypothetical protein
MMPQGRPELHERFGDDSVAWELLKARGWSQDKGWMRLPEGKLWKHLSRDEEDAAEYLVTEWDWAFAEGTGR